MVLYWIGLALMGVPPVLMLGLLLYIHARVVFLYIPRICRIIQEKPLFIVPRDQPRDEAEVVRFRTPDGVMLHGCYYKGTGKRQGVILFGLEFTSDCWSCWSYCEQLIANGYDVFAFNCRNSGASEGTPGYEPMYWVTEYEVTDTLAAVAYLKSRPDADPRGIGFFGVSKGAGAGVLAASRDPYILCCITDGLFGAESAMLPHMRQWFRIYNNRFPQVLIPGWYYRWASWRSQLRTSFERHCRFAKLERVLGKLKRPLLMIQGEQDSYIKPETAQALHAMASEPKELWMVENAKHNQSLNVAGKEYHERILKFFNQYLGNGSVSQLPLSKPAPRNEQRQEARRYQTA